MRRPPGSYILVVASLVALAVLVALVAFGIPPFDNFGLFILSQVASALTLMVFGVIGGAFVGMIVAHRILANREFSPFERSVMEGITGIQSRLDALEKRLEEERARR